MMPLPISAPLLLLLTACPACERADSLAVAGDTAAAIEVLRQAARPGAAAEVWGELGLLLTRTAPYEALDYEVRLEAERAIRRALDAEPSNPRWSVHLTLTDLATGQSTTQSREFRVTQSLP